MNTMKKTLLLITALIALAGAVHSEGIKIYAPIAQNMLTDKGNFVRYSPVNMFDGDSATVYAVTFGEVDKKGYLLDIRFAEPAVFDELTIKAGYFDKKYFGMNDRIKDISVEIWNCFNKDYEKSLALDDIQKEQSLYSGGKIIATKIRIKVASVYAGSKWDDLVISDLNFYLGGKRQGVSFGEGKCISGEDFKWYEYDEQGRVSKESHQAGKAGGRTTVYKYENGKTYVKSKSWEDDSDFEPPFVDIAEVYETDKKGHEVFKKDGKTVAEKFSRPERDFRTKKEYDSYHIDQYIYDEKGFLRCILRICENNNWANEYTEYTYNEKGQLVEKVGYADATIYTDRYTEE